MASVALLAAHFLREVRGYIGEGVSPHIIVKGFRWAVQISRWKSVRILHIYTNDQRGRRSEVRKRARWSETWALIIFQAIV